MILEHTTTPDWPGVRDGSFASRVASSSPTGCSIALLGMPDDTGVALNNGYPGAAQGPSAFRAALARYGTAEPHGFDWPAVFDAGDVRPGDTIEETHDRVSSTVHALVIYGLIPIGIGGGHDLTYPFVRGVLESCDSMCGIYLDAHLDVREEIGSGMPFRKLLESPKVQSVDVIGLDPFVNSRSHMDWFLANGGRHESLSVSGPWPSDDLFFSIDLDAIDAANAPGVSARNPGGMSPRLAAQWAEAAGASNRVRCFDIMELCPPRDEDGRTARLAAHLFLSFLRGIAQREQQS